LKEKVKKTILIVTWPEPSNINCTFSLASALSEQGNQVVYATLDEFKNYIASHGYPCLILDEKNDRVSPSLKLMDGVFQEEEKYIKIIKDYFHAQLPDLVIIHHFFGTVSRVIHRLKIPVVFLNPENYSLFNSGLPPVFSDIYPKSFGIFWKIKMFFSWLKLAAFKHKLAQNVPLYRFLFYYFTDKRLSLRIKRLKQLGGNIGWCEYGPRLLGPELVVMAQEFDFPHKSKALSRCYIGCSMATQRKEEIIPWASKVQKWGINWEELDRDKPLIYCSLGSLADCYPNRSFFFQSVIQAFKERNHLQLILHCDDASDQFTTLPENVILAKWVPQLKVLSKATLFITHGGASSVRESVYYGVPMIVYPFRNDQFGMAARVAYHHLGVKGNIRRVNEKAIGKNVDMVLADNSYVESVQKMQQFFQKQSNCEKGVQFIEDILKKAK